MIYQEIFKKFSDFDGSKHIASEFALKGIEDMIYKEKIKSVFEFGIGIGTIPYLVASINSNISYTGTETNDFCIRSFKDNLSDIIVNTEFQHIKKYSDYNGGKVDLVIIDGSFKDSNFIKEICHKNTIIMIEGLRKNQREFIASIYPKALISSLISNKKNEKYSPYYREVNNPYNGGYTIIRLNYNFNNIIKYLLDKIQTSIKYKLRFLKK